MGRTEPAVVRESDNRIGLYLSDTTFKYRRIVVSPMEACVLLGDVVGSRELTDRAGFSESLRTACREVNRTYEDVVVAAATPLKGIDELGVVFDDRRSTYGIAKRLLDEVHPTAVRFGVAEGGIDVGVAGADLAEMDGPAFHRADELVAATRKAGLLFDADFSEPTLDRAIADEINMLLRWRSGLSERQFEYLRAYEHRGTQAGAAEDLGVTQQSVSKELRRAGHPFVNEIEGRLARTLEEYTDAG